MEMNDSFVVRKLSTCLFMVAWQLLLFISALTMYVSFPPFLVLSVIYTGLGIWGQLIRKRGPRGIASLANKLLIAGLYFFHLTVIYTFGSAFGGWSELQSVIVTCFLVGGIVHAFLGVMILSLKNWARVVAVSVSSLFLLGTAYVFFAVASGPGAPLDKLIYAVAIALFLSFPIWLNFKFLATLKDPEIKRQFM